MIWLSWRQARLQLLAVYALVLAGGLVLLITGRHLAQLAATTTNIYDALTSSDRTQFYTGIYVLAVAPAVLGVFWGAPLVAHELETGTHRLAWTQSVTRTRWLAVKLGSAVLASAVAVGILTFAITRWARPLDGATSETQGNLPHRLTPVTFAMRGIVPVSYAVFAVVLGVAVGLLLRRTLPAMAITLAIYIAVQVIVPLWVRPHLIPPRSESIALSAQTLDGVQLSNNTLTLSVHTPHAGDWILTNQTVDSTGRATALPSWFSDCLPNLPPPGATQRQQSASGSRDHLGECLTRLNGLGYRQHVVYQPQSRFWPLQWVESGVYLAVSGLLAAGCFWWTRRRLS